MSEPIAIANPGDHDWCDTLFEVWFGVCARTTVYVWTRGDACDTAFEAAVDWADDHGYAGFFTTLDESDLREAADDLGVPWAVVEEALRESSWDGDAARVLERAEADLTVVGHTQLDCVEGGPAYVPSWEWGLREVTDPDEIRRVRAASIAELERDETDDESDVA